MSEDLYPKYRAELAEKLFERFTKDDVDYVLGFTDFLVSTSYKVVQKDQTDIIKYEDNLPYQCKVFLVSKKLAGYADGTLFSIRGTLETFFRIVNKDIEDVNANDIRMYLVMFKGKVSDASLDRSRGIIANFFTWCLNEGYIEKNPANNVNKIKGTPGKPREPLTLMELELMRKACDTLREKAIFETLYSTGCRVAELCGLNRDDLNINNGTVHLFGKGKKHRTSFLNAKAKIAITDYLKSRTDNCDPVFVSDREPHDRLTTRAVEGIIGIIAKKSGVERKVTPHILRHTMATIALSNGMKIEEISKILGHASIDTTMIYAKVNLDDAKINHSKCIV